MITPFHIRRSWWALILVSCFWAPASRAAAVPGDSLYRQAFSAIAGMLEGTSELSFKKAVFIVENVYLDNRLSYEGFNEQVQSLALLVEKWCSYNELPRYGWTDSLQVLKSYGLYAVLRDTLRISAGGDLAYAIAPYRYNPVDVFGRHDWKNTFVTQLLGTNAGNCHSLAYLYKILADETGVTNAWLALAPAHIYIRNYSRQAGWYNTELTSGQFPVDAWIMASGYVSLEAIRSGIYMDTLSTQQAVAGCLLDLAKGYEKKYNTYTDSFIVNCCDQVLRYHPQNVSAIICKAEALKKMYMACRQRDPSLAAGIYAAMEQLYLQAMDLGYKEMPESMYRDWLMSASGVPARYTNKKTPLTRPRQR